MDKNSDEHKELVDSGAQRMRALYVAAVRRFHGARGKPSNYGDAPIPQWDGGETAFGKKCKPIWPKIVKFLAAKNLNPNVILDTVFQVAIMQHWRDPPRPPMFMNDAMIALHEQVKQQLIDEKTAELFSNQQSYRTWYWHYRIHHKLDERDAMERVLDTRVASLNPMFRYVTAVKNDFSEIAAKCRGEAIEECMWNEELLEGWHKFLPPELVEEANELRDKLGS